ncbi:MAG: winged helix-turn-helix transcriptional regulator, partial [Candidatus Poseidoniales archaeon]
MRGIWLTRILLLVFLSATLYGAFTLFAEDAPESEEQEDGLFDGPLQNDEPADESDDAESADLMREEDTPLIVFSGLFFEFMRVVLLIALVAPMLAARKTHREDELTKGRILGYIEANAGIHFSALRDGLHLANGVTAYHTSNLEKEGKIFSWKDGKNRRYASTFIPKAERKAIQNPLSGTRLAILEVLAEKGQVGVDTKEIRERLAISRQLLSHHINELKASELIERNEEKKRFWRPSDHGLQ